MKLTYGRCFPQINKTHWVHVQICWTETFEEVLFKWNHHVKFWKPAETPACKFHSLVSATRALETFERNFNWLSFQVIRVTNQCKRFIKNNELFVLSAKNKTVSNHLVLMKKAQKKVYFHSYTCNFWLLWEKQQESKGTNTDEHFRKPCILLKLL